ncbi:MAG: glycosyltransferase [Deltaproteobacteria bacterium]|jgi:glycosyltransferase involved in cell wall biosynthesis|nr:glycosyltransferase [Deltaproteobacteria bacterium]MBW2718043.1 glycosyltransferase [Deltaproteobacteria bacterium]
MKIAQVCYRRYPSPVHIGGGDVRFWQDLRSLTELGHEVHVLTCDPRMQPTAKLEQVASTVTALHPQPPPKWSPNHWIARGFNPETVRLAFPDLFGLRSQTNAWLDELRPDLIWAEDASAVLLCGEHTPIVHSHHDFMFKLRPVRRRFSKKRLRRPDALSMRALKNLEVRLCSRAAATVCASQSEADYLQKLGIDALYLPVTGETTPAPDFNDLSSGRLFIFGNPNTAMRATRHHLAAEIWPHIERQGLTFEWHQLGQPPRPGMDPSWPWVEEHCTVHGYVPDLADVLRPGDASIMPYPFDTGGRAKFAVSAGYGVVNIAYEETFKCASEFTHRENCLAARAPEHFVELLEEFCSDSTLRRHLAEGSRALYERHHTMEAQLPSYEGILSTALQ